jgi:hypothetical protein
MDHLKNELTLLYSCSEFSKKHAHQIVEVMTENNFRGGFEEVLKLADLTIKIPNNTAATKCFCLYFSCLLRMMGSPLVHCCHGGIVVSVLATGSKGCGFEPNKGDGFIRAIKICSTPSFGWEVKLEVPCRKILWYVKDILKSHGDGWTKFSFPSSILLLAPEMSLLAGPPDSTGGCQSALVDKLRVSHS